MAAKRGKSQARRNHGNRAGLPGWAWLVLGIVLTLAVVMFAPRLLRSGDGDSFLRPRPNPDARPADTAGDDGDAIADTDASDQHDAGTPKPSAPDAPKPTQYDFYTLLPGEEVAMTDAELAATEREEAARKAQVSKPSAADANVADAHVADTLDADAASVANHATPATSTAPPVASNSGNDAPYILQAGAFGASGDAETVKAKIALLGLGARVESAQIGGKTVYRVRMGPYGTASELAEAKRKLANGGLPALAIKAK